MARKTKEQEVNLFYLKDEEEKKPVKKVAKKKDKKKKKIKKQEEQDKTFSFENEIVIGVTKNEENKKVKKKEKEKEKKKKIENKIKQKNKKVENKKKTNNRPKKKRKVISDEQQQKRNKKRKKIFRSLKIGTTIVLFITIALCTIYSPLFNIKSIQIEGNNKISENEIISLSQIQMEENIFSIKEENIRKKIKENAYIDKVKMVRKLPSTIILKIEERIPMYLLEYAGSYIYLDKQGYFLEISTQKLELPILQGAITATSTFEVGNRLCIEDLEKLSTVLRIMELAEANEIKQLITRIDIENKDNFIITIETKQKIVYLGDSTNLNTKILSMKAILEKTEGIAGEIFMNKDLNNEYPVFRQRI